MKFLNSAGNNCYLYGAIVMFKWLSCLKWPKKYIRHTICAMQNGGHKNTVGKGRIEGLLLNKSLQLWHLCGTRLPRLNSVGILTEHHFACWPVVTFVYTLLLGLTLLGRSIDNVV